MSTALTIKDSESSPRAVIFAGPVAHVGVDTKLAARQQVSKCRAHADRSGWRIVGVRIEKRPAEEGVGRLEIARLIRDADARLYDLLVVDRVRRLGTPPTVARDVVQRIERTGVRVVSVLPDAGGVIADAIDSLGLCAP